MTKKAENLNHHQQVILAEMKRRGLNRYRLARLAGLNFSVVYRGLSPGHDSRCSVMERMMQVLNLVVAGPK